MTKKPTRYLLALTLFSSAAVLSQQSGNVRPEKAAFQNFQSWPATKPGEVRLKNFRPFRAVYERNYLQGSGPNAGDLRVDRVIVTAEEVGWDGTNAALITLIDSADAKWADTAARSLFMIVDLKDLHLLFESGPIPGKAKDYYFVRPEAGMGTMITTDAGTAQQMEFPKGAVGFGPGPWALGSLDLKEGAKIRLDPFVSPAGNIFGIRDGVVKGRRQFRDLSGKTHSAWLLERGGNLSSSRMGQIYVTEQPPYFLARFSVDLDSGEETRGVRLKSFQYLD